MSLRLNEKQFLPI